MALKIRKKDILILTIAAVFLGVFIAMQYALIKPSRGSSESSESMAVEIEHLAKNNADIKNQVTDLTKKYQTYKDSLTNKAALDEQIAKESQSLAIVNATSAISGQGIEIIFSGKLAEAQMVDLVNAIKNIGADAIAINGKRLNLYTAINQFNLSSPYTIDIIGNSTVLESALSRKGGIVELLKDRGIDVRLIKKNDIILPAVNPTSFKYAKIVEN